MASRQKDEDCFGDIPWIIARAHALARKFSLTAQQRDEVVQETMVQVIRRLRQFRGEAKIDTWIFKIMRHSVGRVVRAEQRAKELVQRLLQAPPSLDDSNLEPVEGLIAREFLELLRAEIQELPELQRQVMQLWLLQHTPFEISRSLSTSVGNVRSAIRAALARLEPRLRLRGYGPA